MKYWRAPATCRLNWARLYLGFVEPAEQVPLLVPLPPRVHPPEVWRAVEASQVGDARWAVRNALGEYVRTPKRLRIRFFLTETQARRAANRANRLEAQTRADGRRAA